MKTGTVVRFAAVIGLIAVLLAWGAALSAADPTGDSPANGLPIGAAPFEMCVSQTLAPGAQVWLKVPYHAGMDLEMYAKNASGVNFDVYDPDKVVIMPMPSPEPPPGPSKLVAADIAKLTGNAAAGQGRIAICYTCHHIGGQGAEFGPDLTMFAKTQPPEVVIDSIINPSKDISHGFEGSSVVTTAGVVDGILLASGDPVIIKSMGGVVQTIPKSKIKEIKKMNRSLMFPADMMGLDAQALADIAAYLRSVPTK